MPAVRFRCRTLLFALAAIMLGMMLGLADSFAHYKELPNYPGATPRELCYELDDDVAGSPEINLGSRIAMASRTQSPSTKGLRVRVLIGEPNFAAMCLC